MPPGGSSQHSRWMLFDQTRVLIIITRLSANESLHLWAGVVCFLGKLYRKNMFKNEDGSKVVNRLTFSWTHFWPWHSKVFFPVEVSLWEVMTNQHRLDNNTTAATITTNLNPETFSTHTVVNTISMEMGCIAGMLHCINTIVKGSFDPHHTFASMWKLLISQMSTFHEQGKQP